MKEQFNFNRFEPDDFEEHISRSIPNYDGLRELIPHIAENFIAKGTNIYDLGTSTGSLLFDLEDFLPKDKELSYIGYDIADNLFRSYEHSVVNLYKRDITDKSIKMFNTNLITSLFTLQFIPFDKRLDVVKKAYDSLNKRGCFLVCEKVYSKYGITEDIFTFSNYSMKAENGFYSDEILNKQKDLKSIMHPLTQEENERMFREAGFYVTEVFFKSLNFIGWVLVK